MTVVKYNARDLMLDGGIKKIESSRMRKNVSYRKRNKTR